MKESEYLLRQKTARILRAGRKLRGINQEGLSEILGVTQSMVSKLESGILGPDAGTWYRFCQELSIDPDITFRTGFVFTKGKKISKNKLAFRFPKNYEGDDVLIKEVVPLISAITELDSEKEFHDHFIGLKIDPDIFTVPNFSIPFSILAEVFNFINQHKKLKKVLGKFTTTEWQDVKLTGSTPKSQIKKAIAILEQRQSIFSLVENNGSIELKINPEFSYSENSKSSLDQYTKFKAEQLSNLLREIYSTENITVKNPSEYHYQFIKA